MTEPPTIEDLSRDLELDLDYLTQKINQLAAGWDTDDDEDLRYTALINDAWGAAIRRALAAERELLAILNLIKDVIGPHLDTVHFPIRTWWDAASIPTEHTRALLEAHLKTREMLNTVRRRALGLNTTPTKPQPTPTEGQKG